MLLCDYSVKGLDGGIMSSESDIAVIFDRIGLMVE